MAEDADRDRHPTASHVHTDQAVDLAPTKGRYDTPARSARSARSGGCDPPDGSAALNRGDHDGGRRP